MSYPQWILATGGYAISFKVTSWGNGSWKSYTSKSAIENGEGISLDNGVSASSYEVAQLSGTGWGGSSNFTIYQVIPPLTLEIGYAGVPVDPPQTIEIGYNGTPVDTPTTIEIGYNGTPVDTPTTIEIGYDGNPSDPNTTLEIGYDGNPIDTPTTIEIGYDGNPSEINQTIEIGYDGTLTPTEDVFKWWFGMKGNRKYGKSRVKRIKL